MAGKKNSDQAADPNPKKRIKKTETPESKAVEVPDAASESVSKLDNQKLLNFLKYRADPDKNKRGEQLQEAQKVLEARCFPPTCFPTTCFPQKLFPSFFPNPAGALEKPQKNAGDKTPEKCRRQRSWPGYLVHPLPSAGLPQLGKRQEADLLAVVESQWFDQFEVVWSIRRDTLWRQVFSARSLRRLVHWVLCCFA